MKILWIDFETRSAAELSNRGGKSVGLHNYMIHPSTQNLMMAYTFGDEINLWECHKGPMPPLVRKAFADPEVTIGAFNSPFERYDLNYLCKIELPSTRFIDPQIGARYLSMPPDLGSVCHILDVPPNLAKDPRGDKLIDFFCKPHKKRKKKGEEAETYFNDWNSHPKEWEEFCEYCKKDVLAEEEIYRRMEILRALPLPPFERKLWDFDQKVNDQGMPVDLLFVQRAYKLALRAKQEALSKQNLLTGLQNANSTDQLLPWVKERGYPYNTLNKNFVDATLKDPLVTLDPTARLVLKARREAASTSYTKLAAILRQVSPDGRLRNQFIFMGSSRCGRWAGGGVQLHNLARPETIGKSDTNPDGFNFEDLDVINAARQMIYTEDYDGMKAKYGDVLSVIKSLIRTIFVAPEE